MQEFKQPVVMVNIMVNLGNTPLIYVIFFFRMDLLRITEIYILLDTLTRTNWCYGIVGSRFIANSYHVFWLQYITLITTISRVASENQSTPISVPMWNVRWFTAAVSPHVQYEIYDIELASRQTYSLITSPYICQFLSFRSPFIGWCVTPLGRCVNGRIKNS